MAGLEGWLQQLAAATSAGIDTPGDQLSAAATLFRIWLPGDPAALAAPKALFEAIDAAGADVDCATGEAPCLTASDDHGFSIDEAEVVYWGTCPSCAAS